MHLYSIVLQATDEPNGKTQPLLQLLFILWFDLGVRWCPSVYPQFVIHPIVETTTRDQQVA